MQSHAALLISWSAVIHVKTYQSGVCGQYLACCVGAVGVGRTLTELAGTHVLQHGVCFHFIVTWRADGRVTCGLKKEISGERGKISNASCKDTSNESLAHLYIGIIHITAHLRCWLKEQRNKVISHLR